MDLDRIDALLRILRARGVERLDYEDEHIKIAIRMRPEPTQTRDDPPPSTD